jgi:hypothetical protein
VNETYLSFLNQILDEMKEEIATEELRRLKDKEYSLN